MNQILGEHQGDGERELVKLMKQNNADQMAYHGGIIVGNQCMHMGQNGDQTLDAMSKAMRPKIKDLTNRKYVRAINVRMKEILKLWFKLMLVMKSKEYQSDAACREFRENTVAFNKAINDLITKKTSSRV